MNQLPVNPEKITLSSYQSRTAEDYLKLFHPQILSSFDAPQIKAIRDVIEQAIPKPSPKIVDLRFTVDLILSRFYIVLFVGKERRRGYREHPVTRVTQLGNMIAGTVLLIGMNLLISAFIFLLLYLIKSALGIDLFSGSHLKDQLKKF
ncbi:MAG: hypothetical protein ACRC8A_16325 [Microcoleaceae cyanobacterium]